MRGIVIIGLAVLAGHGALAADTPMPLKPGPGAELASAYCNACHTSDYIIMNSPFLSPTAWKAEVTKMRAAFGAPLDDAVVAEITSYLAAHYASSGKP
jgi:mono/diheme cytochrome c family protein